MLKFEVDTDVPLSLQQVWKRLEKKPLEEEEEDFYSTWTTDQKSIS